MLGKFSNIFGKIEIKPADTELLTVSSVKGRPITETERQKACSWWQAECLKFHSSVDCLAVLTYSMITPFDNCCLLRGRRSSDSSAITR